MCSCKNKLHNKAKTPFKKTALKPPSIKSTLTTIFHNLNRHNNKMCSCKQQLCKPRKSTIIVV